MTCSLGLRSCIVVSDGYHIFRAKGMLEHLGIRAYGSPRPEAERGRLDMALLCLREAVGYLAWKVGLR